MSAVLSDIPVMDAGTAEYLGTIAGQIGDGSFELGGAAWRFSMRPVSFAAPHFVDPFAISIEWGSGQLHMLATRAVLSLLYRHQFPDAPVDALPEEVALAAFHLAWRDVMARLEMLSGRRIQLIRAGGADAEPSATAPFRFAVTLESERAVDGIDVEIATDAAGLGLLALLARQMPRAARKIDDTLPVALRLEIGEMWLPAAALRTVALYDVLLPDSIDDTLTPTVWLRADARHSARARIEGYTIVIETLLETSHNTPLFMPTSTHSADVTGTSDPVESADLDTVPALDRIYDIGIRVSFDLGTKVLTLGELSDLRAGQILNLNAALPRLVSIRANGRLMGRGELVRVADQIGVRVLELLEASAQTHTHGNANLPDEAVSSEGAE